MAWTIIEILQYSTRRTAEQGLSSLVHFRCHDINTLKVEPHACDLGVCLGGLYIFREAGWNALREAIKPQASD
jgi:hypothetical protein